MGNNIFKNGIKKSVLFVWLHMKCFLAVNLLLYSLYRLIKSIIIFFITYSDNDIFSQFLNSVTVYLTVLIFSGFFLISGMHNIKTIKRNKRVSSENYNYNN